MVGTKRRRKQRIWGILMGIVMVFSVYQPIVFAESITERNIEQNITVWNWSQDDENTEYMNVSLTPAVLDFRGRGLLI